MVIDVVDLDFNTLRFSKRYEPSRYNLGTQMYNRGNATIDRVEKTGESDYLIKAKVKEGYYYYATTLEITGNLIKNSSCICGVYRKGDICKHIIATSMEAIGPHRASTRAGQVKLENKRKEEQQKRLEELRKKQEEEKRQREYKRKYETGINALSTYKRSTRENMATSLDLKDIYYQTIEEKNTRPKRLAKNIKLECEAEIEDDETLKISFKIGQTRMYVVKDICKLYEAYKNDEEIYYGKQLSFVPKIENFTEDSRPIFEFIIKYAEMAEYMNKHSRYGIAEDLTKSIFLTGNDIDNFIENNKEHEIIVSNYNHYGEYKLTDEKLNLECIFSKEKVKLNLTGYFYYDEKDLTESVEYTLKLNIKDYEILKSNEKIYVFYKEKIYAMNKDIQTLRLFELFENQDKIIIPEDKLEEFKQIVFPQIKCLKTKNLTEQETKEALVVNELASKILLDVDDNGNILLELKFCYLDYEFNILENEYKNYVKEHNIVRDIPKEAEVVKRIFMDGFELVKGKKHFIMKNENDIYDFLSEKIKGYMDDFEVLATDKFKNKQIRQPKISNIGIKIDNGLLEIDMSKINIDIEELKGVLKDYNIKKKYHKLKNGDFLDLTSNKDLDLLDEMATTLDIDYSKIQKGVVELPVNRSFYLERLTNINKDINVSKNEEFTDLIDSIGNTKITENIKLNPKLENKLRDYQKVGYKWLKTLEKYKFGGILADDMGLGKTLQIIAVLTTEAESKNKSTSIVVCPSTLVLNWKAEVEKWSDSIKVLIINGNVEERLKKISDYSKYDLIITSYDLLKRDIENYEDKHFKYIIADEAQYIKNSTTQNATSLKSLKGEIKFALTGTPIENSVAELWSIFDFIMPGYLYNYNKFKKKFEEPILKLEDKEALARLKRLISPFVLRRVKKDVLTELPEKNITIMKNEMETEQEKIYLSYLAQTKKEVAEELNGNSFEKSKFKILMLLTRLRQICCHPSLFIENYKESSGKLKQCIDLIIDAIESEHKILLFSSYTSMFEIIEKELEKNNIKYFKLVGNTPVNKRIEMVDEFNNNQDIKVFLISLKAGGTGLNLTSADVVIHYDPWWNVSSENQATDRAYRIGQKNSVQVYKLITSNSIEEKINKMQERKEKLSKDILSTEETFISKMSKEEILDLFK